MFEKTVIGILTALGLILVAISIDAVIFFYQQIVNGWNMDTMAKIRMSTMIMKWLNALEGISPEIYLKRERGQVSLCVYLPEKALTGEPKRYIEGMKEGETRKLEKKNNVPG